MPIMSRAADPLDPKGLIAESFRIDGIGDAECRSILLDWAIGLGEAEPAEAARRLLERHEADHPDHPMTGLLRSATGGAPPKRRRGGARGRLEGRKP